MGCEGRLPEPTGQPRIGRRYRRETGPPTPIPLAGDPRTALVDHRRRPPGARRRRRRQPARRRPHHGGSRASAQQGARGLRDQRRAPAGEEGGHQPAGLRRAGRRAAAERGRDRGGRHRRAGVPQHHGRGRRPGPGRGRRARGRGGVRRATRRSRGERINVEFISANPTGPLHLGHTRWAAVGDALARVLDAAGGERGAGVLHQRPRVADGQVRRLGRGPGEGRAGAGGRLPGRVRRGRRAAGARRGAGHPRPARRGAGGRVPGGRLPDPARGAAAVARHLPHPLRRLVLGAVAARRAPPWPTAWRSCAARATCSTPTVRSGCGPPTSATTRTGC